MDHSITHDPKTILGIGFSEADDILFHPRFLSKEWVDYPGDYVKTFYDVELKDGTILSTVYPNSEDWDGHDPSEIKRVRFSTTSPFIAYEDEQTDEM